MISYAILTAIIVTEPSLHISLSCPSGTNVAIGLDEADILDRERLEKELPEYCREYCPSIAR